MSVSMKLKILVREIIAFFVILAALAIMILGGCTSNPQVKEEEKPISVREVNVVDALVRLNAEMGKLIIAVDELNVGK